MCRTLLRSVAPRVRMPDWWNDGRECTQQKTLIGPSHDEKWSSVTRRAKRVQTRSPYEFYRGVGMQTEQQMRNLLPSDEKATCRMVTSRQLMECCRELIIVHAGEQYRLRITANNKLILTK
ncbi:hemin uptake protein HemP [Geobacter sp. DSM 9736]|uniref:hemin uptake protein HemP n=1 Tax=Geobacter sp. DSM 9736 TaxID=1277350 RepID=UPI001E4BCDA1|nr:hemin uptake protein HemP [Geobacter sp. DSM 9736]